MQKFVICCLYLLLIACERHATGAESRSKIYVNDAAPRAINEERFFVALMDLSSDLPQLIGTGSLFTWGTVLTSCQIIGDFTNPKIAKARDVNKFKLTVVPGPQFRSYNLALLSKTYYTRQSVAYSVHKNCTMKESVEDFGGTKIDTAIILLDRPFTASDGIRLMPLFSFSDARNKMFLFQSFDKNRTCLATAFRPLPDSYYFTEVSWQILKRHDDLKTMYCHAKYEDELKREICVKAFLKSYDPRYNAFTFNYLGMKGEGLCYGDRPYHRGSPLSCPHPAVISWRIPDVWYTIATYIDNMHCTKIVQEHGGPYNFGRLDTVHFYLRVFKPNLHFGPDEDLYHWGHPTEATPGAFSCAPTLFPRLVLLMSSVSIMIHFQTLLIKETF